jgi:hypothetical protein
METEMCFRFLPATHQLSFVCVKCVLVLDLWRVYLMWQQPAIPPPPPPFLLGVPPVGVGIGIGQGWGESERRRRGRMIIAIPTGKNQRGHIVEGGVDERTHTRDWKRAS